MSKNDQDGKDCVQKLAAIVMTLAPGSALGFYTAMAGFYIHRFDSPAIFISMILCLLLPGPVLSLMQYTFDEYFDRLFSTDATYLFRVVALQVVLAVIALVWAWMPQVPMAVLAVGLIMGFIALAIVSSSSQLGGAINPQLNLYLIIGRVLGGAMPLLVFFVIDFKPDSSVFKFRLALAAIPATCLASSALLWYLHSTTDAFKSGFRRLSVSQQEAMFVRSISEEVEDCAAMRYVDETAPLSPAPDGRLPVWVCVWNMNRGLIALLAGILLAFVGFFGKPSLAQTLSLAKLFTDLAGVLVALPLPALPCFMDGPWHCTLAIVTTIYVFLFIALGSVLLGGDSPKALFIGGWLLYYFINALVSPHIAVTVCSFVAVKDRKRVLLANVASANAGFFFGAAVAAVLAYGKPFGFSVS